MEGDFDLVPIDRFPNDSDRSLPVEVFESRCPACRRGFGVIRCDRAWLACGAGLRGGVLRCDHRGHLLDRSAQPLELGAKRSADRRGLSESLVRIGLGRRRAPGELEHLPREVGDAARQVGDLAAMSERSRSRAAIEL